MGNETDPHRSPMPNPMGHLSQLDMGRTLTNERTYGRNERSSRLEESSSVPDAAKAVEEGWSSPLGDALDIAIESFGRLFDGSYERMGVLNRVPRSPSEANYALRCALLERDGGKCWMCGRDQATLEYWGADPRLVIEHLRPRSSYEAANVHLADRSDNLRIGCWDCNSAKSNREVPFRAPLPIVWICPTDFLRYDEEAAIVQSHGAPDSSWLAAWCDTCAGAAIVPPTWHLAELRP